MDIADFIKSLDEDRGFKLQLAGEKYVHPVMPQFMKLDLDERLREYFAGKGITLFYSHQVKAIDLIRQGQNVVLFDLGAAELKKCHLFCVKRLTCESDEVGSPDCY